MNPAHSWHALSIATGTCRPCQLSYLDAHLLHYSPGPHKAGCFFGMKMWTWFNKRQVVSVTGITLSLWKSTQTFLKIGFYMHVYLKIRAWKKLTFLTINHFDGILIHLTIFMVRRYRILYICNMWVRLGKNHGALSSNFCAKSCICFRCLVLVTHRKISRSWSVTLLHLIAQRRRPRSSLITD